MRVCICIYMYIFMYIYITVYIYHDYITFNRNHLYLSNIPVAVPSSWNTSAQTEVAWIWAQVSTSICFCLYLTQTGFGVRIDIYLRGLLWESETYMLSAHQDYFRQHPCIHAPGRSLSGLSFTARCGVSLSFWAAARMKEAQEAILEREKKMR